MAKKQFNLGEPKNLQSKGVQNFFPNESVVDNSKKDNVEKEDSKPLIKTFSIYEDDFAWIEKYVLYKGFTTGKKYTQKETLHDAINLLKKKYPDVQL